MLIFFIVIVIFSSVTKAEFTPFDFSLGKFFIEDSKELKVDFEYDLLNYGSDDFLVRPLIENGVIEILNPDNGSWVGSFKPLAELPSLREEMVVRIKGFVNEKTLLKFEIFNKKSGEIFTTPSKSIWSGKIHFKYLERLNGNLSLLHSKKEETEYEDSSFEYVEINKANRFELFEKIDEIPRSYILVSVVLIFISSFLVGFRKRISRKKVVLDVDRRIYGQKW